VGPGKGLPIPGRTKIRIQQKNEKLKGKPCTISTNGRTPLTASLESNTATNVNRNKKIGRNTCITRIFENVDISLTGFVTHIH